MRVVVVEDQPILAMELELMLLDHGCEVVGIAADQATAAILAERHKPNLALVDLNLLDGLSGPAVAHELVSRHGAAVIFMTANPEQIPEGFAGALGVVCKPFDESTLKDVVDFACRFRASGDTSRPPRRLRLAPWLQTPPPTIAPH
ncbi:response regulator [Brevundimonas poindexterae]|uniref:response regulator n=1 Tax=Brevundimonas poindexterae TaxID=74325 RepID=UPI001CFE0BB0|nr:response regulator [Brevundimonas poindexterae]